MRCPITYERPVARRPEHSRSLLLAEATLTASIVLALFGLRGRFGLAPVYLVVGAFQYLQIVLATAVRIEILPGMVDQPGVGRCSSRITTFVVLLTYIELDADETRKVAYGVVISNLAVYAVAAVAGWHLVIDGHHNPLELPVDPVLPEPAPGAGQHPRALRRRRRRAGRLRGDEPPACADRCSCGSG